jgi:hypothetical protein
MCNQCLFGLLSPFCHVSGKELESLVEKNTDGEYAGVGGRVHHGQPPRIMRVAIQVALGCARDKLLAVVTKSNA